MRGPEILARTMSVATRRGKASEAWQYHSRSDSHSKIACWTVLFDLLSECDIIRRHAAEGRIGFAINHVMVGPINKTLDLVITVKSPTRPDAGRLRFSELIARYGILLSDADKSVFAGFTDVEEDRSTDVSEVAIALEAKACMTEHLKSLPRLHAEVLATGYLAKRAVPDCITVSYSLVNAAPTFRTPSGAGQQNTHTQPADAARVVEMLSTAIPMVRGGFDFGYDVIGVSVIECRNDGSPVSICAEAPAPQSHDHVHYERMIRSICSAYRSRFAR
jgi:hypothetical protein